jgi:hypothetical protein
MKESHCGKAFLDDKGYCRHFIKPPTGAADLGACGKVSGRSVGCIGAGYSLGRTENDPKALINNKAAGYGADGFANAIALGQ